MDVDTIVALATTPGGGAIAVVRLSGPGAADVLARLTGRALPEVRRATSRELRDPDDGALLDRAIVTRWVRPTSFTGEDVVEISCHGGRLVPSLVLDACERAGARRAEPGEFTRRAYLNGKLDLVQAEAIADLVEGRSRAMHRAALVQLERGLSERVGALRERLVHVEALLAHHVDFPEEDDAPVPLERVMEEAEALTAAMDALLATAPEGELLRDGALVVFAGPPNAGKSSLYNALLGRERAIVTEEAGTTRDALEAEVQLGGFPFRLVDTAGLRRPAGRVEQLGIEVARRYLSAADIVLFCLPAGVEPGASERSFLAEERTAPVVVVRTMVDRNEGSEGGAEGARRIGGRPEARLGGTAIADTVRASVRTGEGLDALRIVLPGLAYSSLLEAGPDVPVLTRARQARALRSARTEVAAFREGLASGLPAEVVGTHLRAAEGALEEVVGLVSTDDVLDVVFRDFCIGK